MTEAAFPFFKRGGGRIDDLPYIKEFLLCQTMHWTWHDIQRTPQPVIDYFMLYRDLQANAKG